MADDFDLALAIHHLDESAEYVPNEDGSDIAAEQVIVSPAVLDDGGNVVTKAVITGALNPWRGSGPRPTKAELLAAWEAYQAAQQVVADQRHADLATLAGDDPAKHAALARLLNLPA